MIWVLAAGGGSGVLVRNKHLQDIGEVQFGSACNKLPGLSELCREERLRAYLCLICVLRCNEFDSRRMVCSIVCRIVSSMPFI